MSNKKLGQHFLISSKIANKIINYSHINENDVVIEIGAGKGALTNQLIKKGAKIIAVEIDKNLTNYLRAKFTEKENVYIINEDILKLEIKDILTEYKIDKHSVKIIGNIPFRITSPLIEWLVKERRNIIEATLMVQKEFADRLTAVCGDKEYSKLSMIAELYFIRKFGFNVKSTMFRPIPKVDACVIQLIVRKELALPLEDKEIQFFITFLNHCFAHPRKTLVKSIQFSLGNKKDYDRKQKLIEIMKRINLNDKIRANELTIENFYKIYKFFFINEK